MAIRMDDSKGVLKLLKWMGVVAIIALPLAFFLKKRKPEPPSYTLPDDDSNIFASELEE